MREAPTIDGYLIERLHALGVRDVFGIPGDYVLSFFDRLEHSKLRVITTCDEQGAGFAADAYARVRGLGVVCITYCVGGLKVANAIAGAYAEKSPVVVISGAPGMKEREKNPLLHHKVREFDTQKKVFEQLTVASTVLSDPQTAFREIDRVLHAALRYKRPVYIELPRDMVGVRGIAHHKPAEVHETSDPKVLREAVGEAVAMINAARRPVILADVEVHRFGLQETLLKLIEKTRIPVAATILGKSVIAEGHPLYLGVYEGAMGREDVRRYVEASDCVIMLGWFMTDINLGVFTARLDPARSINASSEKLTICYHNFENVRLKDFLRGLIAAKLKPRKTILPARPNRKSVYKAKPGNVKITVKRFFERLNSFLEDNTIVVTDVGDALFGAADLFIHKRTEFLGPAYYASMGFAVPAALGAEIANPEAAPARARRRRRVSNDRHGTLQHRTPRPAPDRHRAQQRRLRHGASDAGRAVQRHSRLALQPSARCAGQRAGLLRRDGGAVGNRARGSREEREEFFHHRGAARSHGSLSARTAPPRLAPREARVDQPPLGV